MCRWFAYISPTEHCLLEDVLITPKHSLCMQVNQNYLPGLITSHKDSRQDEKEIVARNRFLNIDGFGLGFYNSTRSQFTTVEGERPVLYRFERPPLRDPNFRSLAANTSTLTLFAHIRASSATPVVPVNNHPFAFGRHLIMHNGAIEDFEKIARVVCDRMHEDAFANMGGRTDSEHFAALYMTHLVGPGAEDTPQKWERAYPVQQMRDALLSTTRDIFEIQKQVLKDQTPGNSLNVCVTDGESMVAMRVRNHVDEDPPSLYYSTKAGVSMNRRFPGTADGEDNAIWEASADWTKEPHEHGKHVIVASEPSTHVAADWTLIEKNHCIMVRPDGSMSVEPIDFGEHLNAKLPTATKDYPKHLRGVHDQFGNRLGA